MQTHSFSPIKAGAAYFAVVFALGFVLGTIRVLWLAPMIGETAAVLAELPVMLTASWFAARWLVRRYAIVHPRARLTMGVFAFALLMIVEFSVAAALFGLTPEQRLDGIMTMPRPIGLAGQIMFGLMPLVVGESGWKR